MATVSLRPFPPPYRAALAITSDIDGCTPAAFRSLHEFLNVSLGLDVGDSFWFYSCSPYSRQPLAYF